MMSNIALLQFIFDVQETLNIIQPGSSPPVVKHSLLDNTINLSSTTTPPISQVSDFTAALIAGTLNIDLTNLPASSGAAINGTGLKVQGIIIQAPIANLNPITLTPGGANPYNLFGAAFSKTLYPGQLSMDFLNGQAPVVAGGAKIITLTGTGTQALNIILLLG